LCYFQSAKVIRNKSNTKIAGNEFFDEFPSNVFIQPIALYEGNINTNTYEKLLLPILVKT